MTVQSSPTEGELGPLRRSITGNGKERDPEDVSQVPYRASHSQSMTPVLRQSLEYEDAPQVPARTSQSGPDVPALRQSLDRVVKLEDNRTAALSDNRIFVLIDDDMVKLEGPYTVKLEDDSTVKLEDGSISKLEDELPRLSSKMLSRAEQQVGARP